MFPSGKHFRTAQFVLLFVDFFPLKKKKTNGHSAAEQIQLIVAGFTCFRRQSIRTDRLLSKKY